MIEFLLPTGHKFVTYGKLMDSFSTVIMPISRRRLAALFGLEGVVICRSLPLKTGPH